MRLVACQECHAQYDVTGVESKRIRCHCGAEIENTAHASVSAPVRRCASCGALLVAKCQSCAYCGATIEREPGKLSLICPECYARNPRRSRFCTSCGVAIRPQPVPAPGPELPCPSCAAAMQVRTIGSIGIHECLSCNGLWVPGESFDALVDGAIAAWKTAAAETRPARGRALRRAARFPDKVVYRRCPTCGSPMHRKNFGRASGVIVDWCGEHGTWLDADELEAIADFILNGRGAMEAAGAAAMSTLRFPSAAEVRSRVEAERLQAGERARSQERWRRFFGRHTEPESGFSMANLLETIFNLRGTGK